MGLALLLLMTITPPTHTHKAKDTTKMAIPASNASQEIPKSVNAIAKLQAQVDGARSKQDNWNRWNLTLGVCAIVLGAGAWFCQRRSANIDMASRPIADNLNRENEHLRELEKLDAQYQIKWTATLAANAKEGASKADERAATAERVTEAERIHGLELQAAIQPRRLTLLQQRDIRQTCIGLYSKPIIVESYVQDEEASILATEIAASLSTFNIQSRIGQVLGAENLNVGLFINGPRTAQYALDCISHALSTIGHLTVAVNEEMYPSTVYRMANGSTSFNSEPEVGHQQKVPSGPSPEGSVITIFVGVKPYDLSG